MARDLAVPVRQAIVTRLNTDGTQTKALTGGRAYGPAEPDNPAWPFVRVDLPVVTPAYEGCGGDDSRYSFTVHGFAAGPDERAAGALAAAISADLDGYEVELVPAPTAYLQDTVWTGTQLLRDTARTDGFHALVRIDVRVAG